MRYINATTENLDKNIRFAIEQAIAENRSIFIYGSTGTGKTYMLHALAKERGEVDNFPYLLVKFRDHIQKGTYHFRMNSLTSQDYLFIDDIGAEKTTEFVQEFLYLLVDKRYQNMKRTVFATNLDLGEFRNRYGDRILSRLSEMCVFLELKGNDRRI